MARTPKRNPGRKRRLGGWVLLTMAAVIAGVWAASGWWTLKYRRGGTEVRVSSGKFLFASRGVNSLAHEGRVERMINPPDFSWSVADSAIFMLPSPGPYSMGVVVVWGRESEHYMEFCLWPLPPLLAAVGVPLLRFGILARRRARIGLCPRCGYDRRGLPVGPGTVCPECGQ